MTNKSVLTLLTPDLRKDIEKHVEGMTEEHKERIYAEVLRLLNEGLNRQT